MWFQSIRTPSGFHSRSRLPFQQSGLLNCYDWFTLTQCYGKALYQRVFYSDREKDKMCLSLICQMLDVLRLCTQHQIDPNFLNKLTRMTHYTLQNWETEGPSGERNLVVHHLIHIPDQLARWGPARNFWMFGFDRYFAFANRTMFKRNHVEATFMAGWRSNFLSASVHSGQILAGEKRFENQLEFPRNKPHTKIKLDPQQLKQCLLRCEPYQTPYENTNQENEADVERKHLILILS